MSQCPTTSGPFRCSSDVDAKGEHTGPCEAQAPEYARRGTFAALHGYWFDVCKVHGVTKHAPECVDCKKG